MGLRMYLPVAIISFLVATTGADVFARITIAGETFSSALREHFHWASVQFVGTLILLGPFVAIALFCAGYEKRARTRSIAAIFAVAMVALLYFYFQGYQGAQRALLEEKWTAAALSVGLLPFFFGVPAVLAVIGAGALAEKLDRRTVD